MLRFTGVVVPLISTVNGVCCKTVTVNCPCVTGLLSLSTTVTAIVTLPAVLFSRVIVVVVGILTTSNVSSSEVTVS